jgi:hypothetical protein
MPTTTASPGTPDAGAVAMPMLTVFHRTTKAAAEKILRDGF